MQWSPGFSSTGKSPLGSGRVATRIWSVPVCAKARFSPRTRAWRCPINESPIRHGGGPFQNRCRHSSGDNPILNDVDESIRSCKQAVRRRFGRAFFGWSGSRNERIARHSSHWRSAPAVVFGSNRRVRSLLRERRSCAGRRRHERRRALRRPASKKRQGTKSREVWRRLCSERYGDLIFAPAVIVGAMPAPGDLDGCARGSLEGCNGHLGRGVDRIDGRSAR